MKNKMINSCCEKHHRLAGLKISFIGILILINAFGSFLSWPIFLGSLIFLIGLSRLLLPKTACKNL